MRLFDFIREMSVPSRRQEGDKKLAAWEKSARLAATIVNPGPDVSRLKAEEVVRVLREQAERAAAMIGEITELDPHPDHTALYGDVLAEARVVDRASWAKLGARSMAQLIGVDTAQPIDGEPDPTDLDSVVEVTAVLTFLSQKTLGQFIPHLDAPAGRAPAPVAAPEYPATSTPATTPETPTPEPPTAPSTSPGVLALVAPNVLATQRAMAVNLEEFALWVCTHEYTHAMQFAAAPWMKEYLQERVDVLIRSFDSESSLLEWARAAADSLRGARSVMDSLLNDVQHAQVDRITALMSVLEGHADVVMDAVPLAYLPSKRAMRRKFTARKREQSKLSSAVGRMSGLDAKTDQYKVGASFVRSAQSLVGTRGFNRVFAGPEFLPSVQELTDASMWVRRTNALIAGGLSDDSAGGAGTVAAGEGGGL